MRRAASIGLAVTLLFGCAENTTRPAVEGGWVSAEGVFVDAVGETRGFIRVMFAFDALKDVHRYPESSRPWMVIETAAVTVSSTGDDEFMAGVAAALEGLELGLRYEERTPGEIHFIGRISMRQAQAGPIDIFLASEFAGRLGTNGVPDAGDLVNVRARTQITDGGLTTRSTIRCDDAVLNVRGVGALAQQAE